jgi:hypothetical protein
LGKVETGWTNVCGAILFRLICTPSKESIKSHLAPQLINSRKLS